jgi:hypothetical protein
MIEQYYVRPVTVDRIRTFNGMENDRSIVAKQALSRMVDAGENSVGDGHLSVSRYGPNAAPLSIDFSIMPFTSVLM